MEIFLRKMVFSITMITLFYPAAFAAEGWACSYNAGCMIGTTPSFIINKSSGAIILKVDQAINHTDILGCNTNYTIDVSDEIGKAMYSAALMAKATNIKIGIYVDSNYQISGNCVIRDMRVLD